MKGEWEDPWSGEDPAGPTLGELEMMLRSAFGPDWLKFVRAASELGRKARKKGGTPGLARGVVKAMSAVVEPDGYCLATPRWARDPDAVEFRLRVRFRAGRVN